MKRIDELGISPWPWRCVKAINAECGRSLIVTSENGGEIPTLISTNALLIAAAPEMYECLHKFVNDVVCSCAKKDCENCGTKACWVRKAKAVLDKASGQQKGGAK